MNLKHVKSSLVNVNIAQFNLVIYLLSAEPATSITMTVEGTEVPEVTVTEGEPSTIVCTSLGSIPTIDILWTQEKDEMSEDITSGAAQTNSSNPDLTFDSVSTLQYSFSKDYNEGMLKCKTSGQARAESKEDIAVLNVRCKYIFKIVIIIIYLKK